MLYVILAMLKCQVFHKNGVPQHGAPKSVREPRLFAENSAQVSTCSDDIYFLVVKAGQ